MHQDELSLRRWLEKQLSSLQIPFVKHEPAINSTFGIPDYSLQFNNLPLWLELKSAKPVSKIFQSNIRPNQKKQLRKLKQTPDTIVGILICPQGTSDIFAVRIRSSTLTSKFSFASLVSEGLALKVYSILPALEFLESDVLPFV